MPLASLTNSVLQGLDTECPLMLLGPYVLYGRFKQTVGSSVTCIRSDDVAVARKALKPDEVISVAGMYVAANSFVRSSKIILRYTHKYGPDIQPAVTQQVIQFLLAPPSAPAAGTS